jgi:hypothetical protein
MGHGTLAQQGDPHVDDVVGEIAALREPLGARVVVGQEVREETPREGDWLVPLTARVLEGARELVEEERTILGRLLLVPDPIVVVISAALRSPIERSPVASLADGRSGSGSAGVLEDPARTPRSG